MLQPIQHVPETNIVGPHTRQWGISSRVCQALAAHHMIGVGMGSLGEGYKIVRHHPHFSHINVCLEGTGQVLLEGRWTSYTSGCATLLPKDQTHGAQSVGVPWRMLWVLYDEPLRKEPTIPVAQPTLLQVDPRPFEWAMLGFYQEFNGAADPHIIEHWLKLIHLQVVRTAGRIATNSRLIKLWEKIDAHLDHPWTAAELARMASMSEVHLRRLTQEELGRSPLQHLSYLRVCRAAYLLESQALTVEAVAWAVGYRSVSAFTAAYKLWLGRTPREVRSSRG